jgi:hypothetical protein
MLKQKGLQQASVKEHLGVLYFETLPVSYSVSSTARLNVCWSDSCINGCEGLQIVVYIHIRTYIHTYIHT